MKSDEEKIWDCFQAMRSADSASAPSFHSLLHARSPAKRRKTTWALPRIWVSLGATAAAAAVLILSFQGRQTSAPVLTTGDQLQAICGWSPSTDTLLASGTGIWDSSSLTDELIKDETTSQETQNDSRL